MILIVDDETSLTEVMGTVLADEGYEVATASNGRQALEQLEDGLRPCLAIVDLMMPVMNGYELRAAMLRDPSMAEIPVAIVSAYAHGHVTELVPAAVVPKPFELREIVDLARRFCGAAPAAGA